MQTLNAQLLFNKNNEIQQQEALITLKDDLVHINSDQIELQVSKNELNLTPTSILLEDQLLGHIAIELTQIQMRQVISYLQENDSQIMQILKIMQDETFPELVKKVEAAIKQTYLM